MLGSSALSKEPFVLLPKIIYLIDGFIQPAIWALYQNCKLYGNEEWTLVQGKHTADVKQFQLEARIIDVACNFKHTLNGCHDVQGEW